MSSVRKKDQTEHRFTVLDKALEGKLTKHDVDMHFKAYKTGVRYGNSHNLIYRLNKWYKSLWEGAENAQ